MILLLSELPNPPKPKNEDEWTQYYKDLSSSEKWIWEATCNPYQYYINKTSSNAMEFDYLWNKVEIKDLPKFILKAFLKG